jgi:hypothetical protein
MTVAISAEGGCAVVEIPDADGEVFAYSVAPVESGDPGWRCWAVERQGDDPEKEHAHRVRSNGRVYLCSCKWFKYSPLRLRDGCKHTRSVKEVLEFYRRLTGGQT